MAANEWCSAHLILLLLLIRVYSWTRLCRENHHHLPHASPASSVPSLKGCWILWVWPPRPPQQRPRQLHPQSQQPWYHQRSVQSSVTPIWTWTRCLPQGGVYHLGGWAETKENTLGGFFWQGLRVDVGICICVFICVYMCLYVTPSIFSAIYADHLPQRHPRRYPPCPDPHQSWDLLATSKVARVNLLRKVL